MNNFKLFLSQIKFRVEYESFYKEIQTPEIWDGPKELPLDN